MPVRRRAGSGQRGASCFAGGKQEAAREGPGRQGAAHTSAGVCAGLLHTSWTGQFL